MTDSSGVERATLLGLNTASTVDAIGMLDGIYEHSPWVGAQALAVRPFRSLAQLQLAMVDVVQRSGVEAQLALIRAHPELAGKAMVDQSLTAESTHEQSKAGLTHCTPAEFALIQQLNTAYAQKFGFPFVLAVRGPRGTGLSKRTIIETLQRRLRHPVDYERAEALRNIHRIAQLRLNDKFGVQPTLGNACWDGLEALAKWTDAGYEGTGQLTVTYLTDAHRACAQHIAQSMREGGFDEVHIDAVGNVVGRYLSDVEGAKTLLTGSHYDTVRNGGKYDGRLGIYVPLTWVAQLAQAGKRLPYHLEVVAFSEEEGQRYKATFIGSSALVGAFQPAWLDLEDADGISLKAAMQHAGLDPAAIATLRRDPAQYLGYVEVHIEQGPVLYERNLPLGVVTSINGSARFAGAMQGLASHAGTTPMGQRHDAAVAVAELLLFIEKRAAQDGDSVGTVGVLEVPNGSLNVVPGQCLFTIDLRAPNDAQRDALVADVLAELARIAAARGVTYTLEETMRAAAAPSAAPWQAAWARAVSQLGLPVHAMPSGAGHDAMMLHTAMPQAMLFVRGENGGISHNPLESTTSDDMQLAIEAFDALLREVANSSFTAA
ncbi:2-oxo-4-hydroxy-4-carboxy-5-ureidoimidazoline decarboxylase [Lampropedia puyangensis]|uniref:2-oxo-4-hydroxy-4-carboxy-5-ureidoimidazoline decarboxylase n=1 Tax=Lampropedia puyangensis TaxID=1330072 RepID=A0A4S8FAB4_9BURK|nr:2-oxo-4-hydroxy-4-carboxy-5-ureidoimidazoline decarboxylase [Lampropedia puyangensis]THU04513.1 2-oxo-4-hydroxy-4-carboxy-5-ureidoimidazoline decarboxylase [Lampropedia puyangensis]